ncbi:50S ribosomal protein L13 [Candidatus Micrarchaeota archaeon]|nr:50S ribosomal protein L13 [Candidatus Micrarchaeota archaeon]
MVVIDGKDLVLGRVASKVAKTLLNGEDVALVNAEKLVISGSPKATTEKYLTRRRLKDKANPEHSPHWPRRPDLLVRRIIRGMLPFKKARGREAFKKLRVYAGVPKELEAAEKLSFVEMNKGKLNVEFTDVQKLCERLGLEQG